jgi:hypothetical protein
MGFLKRAREGTSARRLTLVRLAIVTAGLLVADRTWAGTAKRLQPQARVRLGLLTSRPAP